jgi:hypothetical protein
MKLERGVSVQANGFRSTGPRYFTVTVSAFAEAQIKNATANDTKFFIASEAITFPGMMPCSS